MSDYIVTDLYKDAAYATSTKIPLLIIITICIVMCYLLQLELTGIL